MKSITLPIHRSPENFVRRYLANRIGNNIRVDKTRQNKNGTWTVSLKAIVPSYVKLKNNSFKTFVYVFDDVSSATVKYEKYDYDFIDKPKAVDLDLVLMRKLDKLTANIQQEILDYGKFSWGKLSAVKYWLGSLHGIIIRCLKENNFHKSRFTDRYDRYFDFLKSAGWINYEGDEKTQIVASNNLLKLHELLISKNQIPENDLDSLAEAVISSIYAKNFVQIRDELKIHAITSYVAITKAYYADAVREGQPIPMKMQSLWLNYRTYNYGPKSSTFKHFRFPRTVAELGSNNFLNVMNEGSHITAVPELFERLLPYQAELAQNVIDI